MNCKPNRLARICWPGARADGHIVTVLRLHPAGTGCWFFDFGPVWELDQVVPTRNIVDAPMSSLFYPDIVLRLIDGGESPEASIEAMKKLHELPNKVTA